MAEGDREQQTAFDRIFQQAHEDQEQHVRRYIKRLETEADFFDELSKEDGLPEGLIEMMRSNLQDITAEFVRAEIAKKKAAVDLKARRKFALYWRAATFNGYSFQAHLIREHVVTTAQYSTGPSARKQGAV